MAKLSFILVISSLLIIAVLPLAYSAPLMRYSQPKVTHLRFFLHDSFSGASQNLSELFSTVTGFEDVLTFGPSEDSPNWGRAQGLFSFSDRDELALHNSVTYVIQGGKYAGSTIMAVGRNNVLHDVRYMAIVGGTGHFELARGTVTMTTYQDNPEAEIYEYNLEVVQDYYRPKIEMKV